MLFQSETKPQTPLRSCSTHAFINCSTSSAISSSVIQYVLIPVAPSKCCSAIDSKLTFCPHSRLKSVFGDVVEAELLQRTCSEVEHTAELFARLLPEVSSAEAATVHKLWNVRDFVRGLCAGCVRKCACMFGCDAGGELTPGVGEEAPCHDERAFWIVSSPKTSLWQGQINSEQATRWDDIFDR